jgi:hypothetical protein
MISGLQTDAIPEEAPVTTAVLVAVGAGTLIVRAFLCCRDL